MATATITLFELAQKWETLQTGLSRTQKLDFQLFEETFTKTYDLLANSSSAGDKIEKKQISLILQAYLFANSSTKELDFKSRAALVLTDRMLNYYITHDTFDTSASMPIYILEARKEIYINFKNVSDSIFTLAKLLEDDYWTI